MGDLADIWDPQALDDAFSALGSFDGGADNESWVNEAIAAAGGIGALSGSSSGYPLATRGPTYADTNVLSVVTSGPNVGRGPEVSVRPAGGQRSNILAAASRNAGMKITTKKLKRMLRELGIEAVIALCKLTAQAILWLIETAPRRGARGPFMRTVVKRVKRGRAAEKSLRKWSHRAGITTHHRAPSPFKKKR